MSDVARHLRTAPGEEATRDTPRGFAIAAAISAIGVVLAGCGSTATVPPGSSTASGAAPAVSENSPAGDIPDNQAFVPFTLAAGRFTVSVPEGWARTTEGAATIFTDKLNTVRVEMRPTAAAPNTESVVVYELPAIASSTPNYRAGTVTAVQRNAGQVMLITYQGSSPPNSVNGKTQTDAFERYEYWHAGQEMILTLSGPVGADNVDPWRTITDSLRWQ